MEKFKLKTLIDSLLPSVDGEDENLITAAKLRSILLSVYDAGVKDALANPNVKVNGQNNKIFTSSYPADGYSGMAFSYDPNSRILNVEEANCFHAGQTVFVFDTTNKVSATVTVESVDENTGNVCISKNDTLVLHDSSAIYVTCLDSFQDTVSNVYGNNLVVFGGNVNYVSDHVPNYYSFEIPKSIMTEITDGVPGNSLYLVDVLATYRNFVAGGTYSLVNLDTQEIITAKFLNISIITFTLLSTEFIPLLKLDFDKDFDLSVSENWSLVSDILLDISSELIIQNGNHGVGKVLTSDVNGKADWQTPSGGSPAMVISTTYADLVAMCELEILVPGQLYSFEHTTKHLIPSSSDICIGYPETLTIRAISSAAFGREAISEMFPKHEIDYDFWDALCEDGTTPRTGNIYRRKDDYNNEVIGFDFYNVRFRRYKVHIENSSVSGWSESLTYNPKDKVFKDSIIYICVKATTGGIVVTNKNYWLQFCGIDDFICLNNEVSQPMVHLYTGNVSFQGDIENYHDYRFLEWTDGNITPTYIHDNYFDLKTKVLADINMILVGSTFSNTFIGNMRNITSLASNISNNYFNNGRDDLPSSDDMLLLGTNMFSNHLENVVFTMFYAIGGSGGFNRNYGNYALFENVNLQEAAIESNIFNNAGINNIVYSSGKIWKNIIRNWNLCPIKIAVGKYFANNDLIGPVNGTPSIDFTLATHVFNEYHCEIAGNSSAVFCLKYVNGINALTIVAPTA